MSGKRVDPVDRFWAKTAEGGPGECWEWTGYRMPNGYGTFGRGGTNSTCLAHRFAYDFLIGPIPEGLQIDHLCGNRGCVNPAHLEAVTPIENVQRATKTHCINGHLFDDENTYRRPEGRYCRACRRAAEARRRARAAA